MDYKEQVNQYGTAALVAVVNGEPEHVPARSLMHLETSQLRDLVTACLSLAVAAARMAELRAAQGET